MPADPYILIIYCHIFKQKEMMEEISYKDQLA